jgi:histidine triad (HIT) family protein
MTIFSKIIDGEIPCYRVYEDAHVLAFLDIGPLSRGHTLLITKQRVAAIHELTDDAAAALGRALPRLCRAIMKATGTEAYNVLSNTGAAAGQEVLHVHFHIIPKQSSEGLVKRWEPGELDPEDAKALAAQIAAHLS